MEDFIAKVRTLPMLWDTRSVKFRDLARKEHVWDRVAQECGLENRREAKILWKRLRDSHREALRRRKLSINQSFKPWKYEAQMEFLLPLHKRAPPPTPPAAPAPRAAPPRSPASPAPRSPAPRSPAPRSPEHKVKTDTFKKLEERMSRRGASPCPAPAPAPAPAPPAGPAVEQLFASLAHKTLALPPELRLRVQRQVFDVVLRAEEQALAGAAGAAGEGAVDEYLRLHIKRSPPYECEAEMGEDPGDEDGRVT